MSNYDPISWTEFRESGMLWFTNRILHVFGLCIVVEQKDDGGLHAYPARTTYRGFPAESEARGYQRVEDYLQKLYSALPEEPHVSNPDL